MKKILILALSVVSLFAFADDDYYNYRGENRLDHLSVGVKKFIEAKEREEGTYIKDIDFERDWKNKKIIEVEVVEKGWEYKYVLHPETGKVLSRRADD